MRSLPIGERALLVLVDDANQGVALRTLVLELARSTGEWAGRRPREVVPAAETVLLDGLPDLAAQVAWRRWLAGVPVDALRVDDAGGTPLEVVLETSYDGPDLDVVADSWGCSRSAVVARHVSTVFTVAFCGFAPGFAYCVAADPLPELSRRDTPRERVPAGAVALAGPYCGIYPAAMPGGWQLVGLTSATLFDPARPEPALLVPGAQVTFRAV